MATCNVEVVLQKQISILVIINQIKWSVYIDRQDGTGAEDDDMTALQLMRSKNETK